MNAHTGHRNPVTDQAEGQPDNRERQDPATPLRTSTIPAIQDRSTGRASETGKLQRVFLSDGEGVDDAEAQDASQTTDEIQLSSQHETEKAMSDYLSKDVPVLIVEDTVELAEVVQATLEGMGFEAVYETHGKSGFERLKQIHPQLVIMDIGLPDITGWQLLDHIKEYYTDAMDHMPTIIVVTAYGDPANRLIGKLQPIHSYLIKPFTPAEVEFLVEMVMRGEKPENPNFGGSPNK